MESWLTVEMAIAKWHAYALIFWIKTSLAVPSHYALYRCKGLLSHSSLRKANEGYLLGCLYLALLLRCLSWVRVSPWRHRSWRETHMPHVKEPRDSQARRAFRRESDSQKCTHSTFAARHEWADRLFDRDNRVRQECRRSTLHTVQYYIIVFFGIKKIMLIMVFTLTVICVNCKNESQLMVVCTV